ncbi:MAG TPA: response regulator [Gemmatimonadaceae bacterium]|nr:response regulator [Gemmatimonadaceae bacterium]
MSRRSASILIVDDDPIARHLLLAVVSRLGCHPSVAESGREAIELARHTPDFDLAIVDVYLPDMLGLEVVEHLRALPYFGERPIVICTGAPDPDLVARAAALRVREFVKKPVQVTEFLLRLRALVGSNKDGERLAG